MAEPRGIELFDFLILVVKRKRLFILITILCLGLSYLTVYFLIPPEYDSKGLIVATEDFNSMGGLGSIAQGLNDLPLANLGLKGLSINDKYDLFTTLIYSRTNLEKLVNKFGLMKDYGTDKMYKAVKNLKDKITVDVDEHNAFVVTVRASSPDKAAKMTNFLLNDVNSQVIKLNIQKSKNNRIFLEGRYNAMKENLKNAEDSLKVFQQKTGLLYAENQIKAIMEEYTQLEGNLIEKQIEKSVLAKIYGAKSPQAENAEITVNEFQTKLDELKSSGKGDGILLALNSLPEEALRYYRYYRNINIYSTLLQFLLPMYEQAKFQEQKDVPVLQVVDYGAPPERKSYPPRTLFALLITIFVDSAILLFLFLKEMISKTENQKLLFIKKEIFNFSKKR